MSVKVFKFGGASLKDAAGVKNVASIIERFRQDPLVVIVSAMGKTTNALEEVVAAHAKQNGEAQALFDALKERHYAIMRELFDEGDEIFNVVNDTFVEGDWVLEEPPSDNYDYMYDQIVCMGELVSSRITAAYL
ncbi:MAG: aspartate kinase, partial [Saprospiraceae bacterium]|nr:aspartate kinase [Saprospiraceae bacterium]